MVHAPLHLADIAGAGSLLGLSWSKKMLQRSTPLSIVGSGFMSPSFPGDHNPAIRILSTRGFLSENLLNSAGHPRVALQGDPGLLINRFPETAHTARPSNAQPKLGVILHHSKADNQDIRERLEHLQPTCIDIRSDDPVHFCRQVLECDVILSQSLHGLIFADSLGVPNAWLFLGNLHSGGSFKYFDYFSSVGRPFYRGSVGYPRISKRFGMRPHSPTEIESSNCRQ